MSPIRNPQPQVLFKLILAVLVLLTAWAGARPRIFNSKDGKPLEAELMDVTDKGVSLRRGSDGKVFTLPPDRLSDADQEWIRDWSARRAPLPHPLGWKRLRIHAERPGVLFGHATLMGNGQLMVIEPEEIYLPAGAWIRITVSWKGKTLDSLVRYDGATDWYVDAAANQMLLRSRADGPQRVVAIEYPRDENIVYENDDVKPLTVRKCAELIGAGSAVSINSSELGSLIETRARPEILDLDVSGEGLDWKKVPDSVRALCVSASSATIDLSGIAALSQLEHLEIRGGKVTGLEALQQLPKLELLAVEGTTEPAQVAHLAKLTNLRHLAFLERSKAEFPADAFDGVGALTKLESAYLGSHYATDKRVNPDKAFQNCPNLTSYHLNQASITDKGAFLEKLPKLTEANFAGGMVDVGRVGKLMDAGHFKHLRSLVALSYYPLRNLPHLQQLVTRIDPKGKNFAEFGELPALREITLTTGGGADLETLAVQPAFAKVDKLTVSHSSLEDYSALAKLSALTHLHLFYSQAGRADLSKLKSLETVSITASSNLAELKLPPGIEDLRVNLAQSLDFASASPLPHLHRLQLENCPALTTIDPLAPCPELARLVLIDCKKLASTAGLEKGTRIESCVIRNCGKIRDREP